MSFHFTARTIIKNIKNETTYRKISMMPKAYSFLLLGLFVLLAQAHEHDKQISFYELKKGNFALNLTNYGASIISVIVPDKHGIFFILNFYISYCKFIYDGFNLCCFNSVLFLSHQGIWLTLRLATILWISIRYIWQFNWLIQKEKESKINR